MFNAIRKSLSVTAVFLAATMGLMTAAEAGFIGHQVKQEYVWPRKGSTYSPYSAGTVTVGAGREFNSRYFGFNISDTSIRIDFNRKANWNRASFSGLHFSDIGGAIADIAKVSLDVASNFRGLTAARIAYDADNIWIDWNGLRSNKRTFVVLNVEFVPRNVNAPAAAGLLVLGLAGITFLRRRKHA